MSELGAIDTTGNGAFYEGTALQIVYDSTSIGALKFCPKYYELSIVRGFQSRKMAIDLDFGIKLHSARERYYHAKAQGQEHEEALTTALIYALEVTFDLEARRPWVTNDPNKNRLTLVRTLVWYLDHWNERGDPLQTIILRNGRPAVELTFKYEIDHRAPGGQAYSLAGHIDRLVTFNGETYVSDLKTTKSTLDLGYFAQFTPDNQLSLYTLASRSVYSAPARGIIIDAAQVAVTFSRFERQPIGRTTDQLDEWYSDLRIWLTHAEEYASAQHWPMNERACYRCTFRPICAKPPSVRAQWLAADYTTRVWDCTKSRGDI